MTGQPTDARLRLPREPYPGLRPFLDFEAALLFGRERQVREVIDHLRETQFVAVLGGSGSGKSSLIQAGVMPELRSYGIPGAGDLWLPLTCTPGTNVSAADSLARRHSPITRLARRFASLLRTRGSEQADAQRESEIADVFRQEAGFARLLETYGADFALPSGPDPKEARVLFVLDQFEEVFHPTNKNVEDATLLVERVLDHFFNPHPHCYVVLTMRSEHLNDCAAFLELPDAINKASYLVRRLDAEELRGAITGPAQRFLRLAARSNAQQLALPEQVVFEEAVLQRLLRDVQAITHDPDHLPLLQHLLARLWEAALEREEMDMPVPARITHADLVRAVNAVARSDEEPLPEKLNTLRACVENWPETLYQWHDETKRGQFDRLFRHLAFKDPNTGLYSQQRIDVDAGARLLGPGMTRTDLRALIAEGFLGSVDYLFWDDEDPARVTLKVSHESFIRGWARFRALIDQQSQQFDEFLGVLRKCADWCQGQRSEDYLLEAGEMRRLQDSGFALRVHDAEDRNAWRRALALDRDGARLARHEVELDDFFGASQRRLADRQLRASRLKLSRKLFTAATVLGALLPTALLSVLVQGPTMRRAELLSEATRRSSSILLNPEQARVGDAGGALDSLLHAVEQLETARSGEGSPRLQLSQWLLQGWGGVSLFGDQRDFLASVQSQAEPPVNGTLRQVLAGTVWRADPTSVAPAPAALAASASVVAAGGAPAVPMTPPSVEADARCAGTGDGTAGASLRGRLFVSGRREGNDLRPLRALFVPRRADFGGALEVFSAAVDPVSGQCTLGAVVLSSPEALDSRVVFDAGLRYFYFTAQGPGALASVIVQEVDWERSADGQVRALQRQTVARITSPEAVTAVLEAAAGQRAAVVPTWRLPGGRQVRMGARLWRIVGAQAQRVDVPSGGAGMLALRPSPPESACLGLARSFASAPGFRVDQYETAQHCFFVARGWPVGEAAVDPARPARDELRVAVHEQPAKAGAQAGVAGVSVPVAALVPFARVAVEGAAPFEGPRWFVGTTGPYAGWLLFKSLDRTGAERFIGLPWSTCALWRMGIELQAHNPPPQPQTGGTRACADRP